MTESRAARSVFVCAAILLAAAGGCRSARRPPSIAPAPDKAAGAPPAATTPSSVPPSGAAASARPSTGPKSATPPVSAAAAQAGTSVSERGLPPPNSALRRDGPPSLQSYLDAYPLGSASTRMDLLATTARHSMHLIQTRAAIGSHFRPTRVETALVVSGEGSIFIGGRSYPAKPGARFRIPAAVVHSLVPDAGSTLVAVCYFEPPLLDADDRVSVE